jgi:SAM-dependent methyltransferase
MQTAQFQLHAEIEKRHWWFVARRSIIRRIVGTILPVGSDALIVDVGCGTGANLALLAKDYPCLGIDVSDEAIGLARLRFPEVDFACGYAPEALGNRYADARLVMLMDVLEHVEDDLGLLGRLVERSSPGTKFVITVPADPNLWSEHDESFGHFRRYELPTFQQLWEGLPVSQRLLSPFNSRLYPVVKGIRTWNRWRGRSQGAAGTDFNLPGPMTNGILHQAFASEGEALCTALITGGRAPFRRGVSLLAVLERI